jgi:hypothetical protein
MTERKAKSQIASLTSDQKKSGIDSIYLATNDVRHTIGKLLMKATTLLQLAKLWGSKVAGIPVSAISLGSPGREKPFGCGPHGEVQSIL